MEPKCMNRLPILSEMSPPVLRQGLRHNMFDAHRLQLRGLFTGEMPLDPLQDESNFRLTVPRPVEAVLDQSFAEFDVLRVPTPSQDGSDAGQDARVGLPPDLVIEPWEYLVKLIRRNEADESTDHVILDHANDRRELGCRESPRLQLIVT